MSNIPVPQARYALLKDNKRKSIWSIYSTFTVSLITFIVLLAFFAVLYVTTAVGTLGKAASPPHSSVVAFKEVPRTWLYRATTYNGYDAVAYNASLPVRPVTVRQKANRSFKLVCYYTFPSNSTNVGWNLNEDNIDADLCTHIIVGFASVVNSSVVLDDGQIRAARNVVALKRKNDRLKVMLSVGGAGDDSGFAPMVVDHANRKTFIRSIDAHIKNVRLDGVDLDWEFPNKVQDGDKRQKMHFTQLLREMRAEINRRDEDKRYLLSVAVAAPVFLIDDSYDVDHMNGYVDFVNLMSYDYHFYTRLTPFTGLNAPLYGSNHDNGYFATLNINYSAAYWYSKGMDKAKIVVGLPTYGHSFKLVNPNNNGVGAPAIGYGALGTNGFIDFADVCWFLYKNRIKPVFDADTKSPYAYRRNEWISYDNEQSLTYKAEFVKQQNYGGAMVLSLNTDDHNGDCVQSHAGAGGDGLRVGGINNNNTFPLTRKIKSILNDEQL